MRAPSADGARRRQPRYSTASLCRCPLPAHAVQANSPPPGAGPPGTFLFNFTSTGRQAAAIGPIVTDSRRPAEARSGRLCTRWRPSHCPWRCGGTDNRRSAGRPRLGCAAVLGYGVLKLVWSLGGTVGLCDPEVLRASLMATTGGATIVRLLGNARTCGIRGRNAGHSLRVRPGSRSDAAAGSPGHHRCHRFPRPQAPGRGDLARHARRAHRCAEGRNRNALSAPAGRTRVRLPQTRRRQHRTRMACPARHHEPGMDPCLRQGVPCSADLHLPRPADTRSPHPPRSRGQDSRQGSPHPRDRRATAPLDQQETRLSSRGRVQWCPSGRLPARHGAR